MKKREMAFSFANRLNDYLERAKLDDRVAADVLEVDIVTLRRWKIAMNVPHQLMWPPVWRRLQMMVEIAEMGGSDDQ
jgi:propanediol dehydratase large subunit